jgi:hypothetical protein
VTTYINILYNHFLGLEVRGLGPGEPDCIDYCASKFTARPPRGDKGRTQLAKIRSNKHQRERAD